jgi:hypothetical protein
MADGGVFLSVTRLMDGPRHDVAASPVSKLAPFAAGIEDQGDGAEAQRGRTREPFVGLEEGAVRQQRAADLGAMILTGAPASWWGGRSTPTPSARLRVVSGTGRGSVVTVEWRLGQGEGDHV